MRAPAPRCPPRRLATAALGAGVVLAALAALAGGAALVLALRPRTVAPHALFEALARAVVEAGDEVARARAGGGGGGNLTARGAPGAYADGTPEVHTGADARASALISARLAAALPGLLVVDEEGVAAGRYAGAAPARAVGGGGGGGGVGAGADARDEGPNARARLRVGDLVAWVDPLDASAEYAEGGGLERFVTLSACVARGGVPVAGVIYAPFARRLYWATAGARGAAVSFSAAAAVEAERARAGAWDGLAWGARDEPPCDCAARGAGGGDGAPPPPPRANASLAALSAALDAALGGAGALRVVVSRAHSGGGAGAPAGGAGGAARNGLALGALLHAAAGARGAALERAGGAGFKALELVEGRADAYAHARGIRKWDICAADALLRASGGRLTDWRGARVCYCAPRAARLAEDVAADGVLAAAKAGVHAALAAALERAGAE